jgi:hypothetical protein
MGEEGAEEGDQSAKVLKAVEERDRNPRILAGFAFLGQFIGHDITHDSELDIKPEDDSKAPRNLGMPTLDLGGLYGSGPDQDRHLYDSANPGKLLLDKERQFDLPRDPQGTALIGDRRNDRNLLLAQLHLAFLKFHNAVYEQVKWINDGVPCDLADPAWRFKKAQRLVRWHYQWVIVREFLPLLVGAEMVHDILINGPRVYKSYPSVPPEFSVAAYRFGHSQIHYLYRINDDFELPLFSTKPPSLERQDLQGGSIKRAYAVDWKNFFDMGRPPTPSWDPKSKKIDTRLSGSLLFPPSSVARNRPEEKEGLATTSLSVRDLQRGQKRGLPSGQEVANEMFKAIDVAALNQERATVEEALEKDKNLPSALKKETPLWYYILKEAEVQHDGERLGDVGGRIVAEVIVGLLQGDRDSLFYRVQEKGDVDHLLRCLRNDALFQKDFPEERDAQLQKKDRPGTWKPVLTIERDGKVTEGDDFKIADLLRYAGVQTQ